MPRSKLIFAAVSIALHVAALAPLALPVRLDAPGFEEQARIELSLISVTTPPDLPSPAALEPEPERAPEPPPRRTNHRPRPSPRPAREEAAQAIAAPEAPDRTQPPMSIVDDAWISPAQVARLAVEQELSAPTPGSDRIEASRQALTARLKPDSAYRATLERRDAPLLQRKRDGSYEWKGAVLYATIAADGSVKFRDPPLFAFEPFAKPADQQSALVEHLGEAPRASRVSRTTGALIFRFDVVDMIERALGKESYSAERRWFLDQTAQLRETMTLRQNLCGSPDQRPLRAYLAGTALRDNVDANVDVAAVHEAIFAAFEACAGSSFGPAAVNTLFGFVRTQWPQGSARAFSAADLAKLNQHRTGGVLFDPHALEH